MRVAVIGAGAWGTALALAAAQISPAAGAQGAAQSGDNAHAISLWARDPAQVARMRADRVNARYLPGVALPTPLSIGCLDIDAPLLDIARQSDLIVLGTPMSSLRSHLTALSPVDTPIAWLCKGFEATQPAAEHASGAASANPAPGGWLGHEIHAQVSAAGARCAVLSGPSFALEVARQQPTALVAASHDAALRDMLVNAFHSASLRVYASDDVVGVEVGGAVKNVLAIATGLCDGLNLGLNARAALITRGLAEMTRLGMALGARAETFMGLSGLGDLVLTATGDLSRNRQVGLLLAQGRSLADAVASLGHVAEGVYSARTVVQRAQALGVEMPIAEAVVALLDGAATPQHMVNRLMGRMPRPELAS